MRYRSPTREPGPQKRSRARVVLLGVETHRDGRVARGDDAVGEQRDGRGGAEEQASSEDRNPGASHGGRHYLGFPSFRFGSVMQAKGKRVFAAGGGARECASSVGAGERASVRAGWVWTSVRAEEEPSALDRWCQEGLVGEDGAMEARTEIGRAHV